MTKKDKIIVFISSGLLLIGGVVTYFILRKPRNTQNKKKVIDIKKNSNEVNEKPNTWSLTNQNVPSEVWGLTNQNETPIDNYNASSALVKSVKAKTDYINGTLNGMKLKNGKIVSANREHPFSIGLLEGIWRMHNEDFNKEKKKVSDSTESLQTKNFANKLIQDTERRSIAIFSPQYYNYQAKWYKDYLSRR